MVGGCISLSFALVMATSTLFICTPAEDACDAPTNSQARALLQSHSAREHIASLVQGSNQSQSDPSEAGASAILSNHSNASCIIALVDACLQNHMAGDEQEQALWDLVRTAEILSKLMAANVSVKALGSDWPDDKGVIEAAMVAGLDAAETLVRKQFEAEAATLLGDANLTQEAIDHFTEKVAKMAEMCGDSSEAQRLADDEASIMSQNMVPEEARIAKELADYVEGLCQSDVLDLDFFVGRLADESPECNALVADSQLLQIQTHLSALDFYAKSALVRHDEENRLGHHFAKRLHRHQRKEAGAVEPLLMQAALKHGSSKPRMVRLFYLDRLYYDKLHGFTKDQYCDSNFRLQKERPEHWISQSQEIRAYVNCVCVRKRPSLWCDAHHAEPLALELFASCVLLHPFRNRIKDADGKPAAFDCSFCVNGNNCISTSGSYNLDVFGSIKESHEAQVAGDRKVNRAYGHVGQLCEGLLHSLHGRQPGDPFQFKLDIGVEVSECGSTADFLATYHYFAELKLCIGNHFAMNEPPDPFAPPPPTDWSVDFKVEVLLGVSIPFVGTVGKWFKVLGFSFMEDDNSREIAKNKAGVTIEYIGPSPWKSICGRTYSCVNCEPYAGDGDNRANEDCRGCGDDFSIWRPDPNNPGSLCIRRDDYNGGWGMNLEIACPVDNSHLKVIVPIGSSSVNTKCAMPDEPVTCRSDGGNQGVR
ncbi:unnamed protein product, partial [Symbiodinium sp. KB8]